MIDKAQRWQATAISAAIAALLGMVSPAALALSLGRITVQSAMGEPLRAEIDIPEINADEAASLSAAVAPPQAFTAAGLEYHADMANLQVSLQRRADGRSYLRVTGVRPINDPFVDMILVATWSAGRIVRDYTMLLDPPALKQSSAPLLPQSSAPASVSVRPAASPGTASTTAVRSGDATAISKNAPTPKPAASGDKITVKTGDTASKIANRSKAADVSLDQMLIALIRSNPDAFINGNLNRLRAGAVLSIPDAQQAQSVGPSEATQQVIAQSKDFNEYRRNLAAAAPKAAVETTDRKASGKVEAKVEDKKPTGAAPDKLTLSKGSVAPKADEAKIAKERADKDAAARAAEIAKNISDLNKLGAAAQKTAPAGSAPAAATPAAKPADTKVAAAPAVTASAPAPAKAPEVAPAPAPAKTPEPASPPAAKTPVTPAAPAAEPPGVLDELLADPMVPAAGAGLLALLGGFGFYRLRQRKSKAAQSDSSFLESRLQPDSFFGASGGQHVETGNEPTTGTGSGTSTSAFGGSMLEGADDVDPVAEADVYLAYGRDAQAEEILKEALRHHPERLAIHTKLLGIYAKRRDAVSFQAAATQAFKLTTEGSAEWTQICDMGRDIDPDNRLYQPGGATPSALASLEPLSGPVSEKTQAMQAEPDASGAAGNVDLDLDLDFSANDAPPAEAPAPSLELPSIEVAAAPQVPAPAPDEAGLDFDLSTPLDIPATEEPPPAPSAALDDLELSMPEPPKAEGNAIEFDLPEPVAAAAPEQAAPAKADDGLLNFDLGSLSLDLDAPAASADPVPALPEASGEDPLETKLALAEEFVSIGDTDGARALMEEVIAEASGEVRAKAERALANLS